jgi:hypothetical protein
VDGFIFLACPLDELSFVAGRAVVAFDISFNDDLAANSRRVIRFLHPGVSESIRHTCH